MRCLSGSKRHAVLRAVLWMMSDLPFATLSNKKTAQILLLQFSFKSTNTIRAFGGCLLFSPALALSAGEVSFFLPASCPSRRNRGCFLAVAGVSSQRTVSSFLWPPSTDQCRMACPLYCCQCAACFLDHALFVFFPQVCGMARRGNGRGRNKHGHQKKQMMRGKKKKETRIYTKEEKTGGGPTEPTPPRTDWQQRWGRARVSGASCRPPGTRRAG